MRIGVDAMGGDYAPQAVVDGALAGLDSLGDDQIILFGDEAQIRPLLGDPARWQKHIQLVHAPETVGMDEQPVDALRHKRHSSLNVMTKYAADNLVDVTISAGNTGAYVAACQMRLRPLPGVLRPGILVVFPTFNGPVAIIDVGANIAPKPVHLYQYAHMGCIYAREVLKVAQPRVGLVSIGQEDAKGNELVKKTNQLLRDDPTLTFIGNVETREFIQRPADVVVCDGFVGNVILKLTEGLAEGLFNAIKAELAQDSPDLVQRFEPIIARLYAKHDYTEYGAAPLLGIAGTCMIGHGSSDARAIKSAIMRARRQVKLNINDKIAAQLQNLTLAES